MQQKFSTKLENPSHIPINQASQPVNQPIDKSEQLLQHLLPLLLHLIRSKRVTWLQDRILELSPKLRDRPEHALVDKVNQTEVLQQIVLDWCPWEENAALAVQLVKRYVRLGVAVLQAVTFVADYQSYWSWKLQVISDWNELRNAKRNLRACVEEKYSYLCGNLMIAYSVQHQVKNYQIIPTSPTQSVRTSH